MWTGAWAPPSTDARVDVLGSAQPGPGRGRRALVLAGVVGLVVVAAGVAAAYLLTRGDGDVIVGGGSMPASVTSEPTEAWSESFSQGIELVAIGDILVVGDPEDGTFAALDEDGEEIWSTRTVDDYSYPRAVPGDDEHVLGAAYESSGVAMYSLDDGEELWRDDELGYVAGTADGRVLAHRGGFEEGDSVDLVALDADSGEELWAFNDVDGSAVADGSVYALSDGEVVRLDPKTGEERWSRDLDLGADDYPSLIAVDEYVVAFTYGAGAVAYDADDGTEIWTYRPRDSDASVIVGAMSSGRVYVNETTYDDDVTEEKVTVFDADGEVGELDNDRDESFYATAFRSDGEDYLLNLGDGSLFDGELGRIGRYDGQLAVADGGVYSLETGELAFYELGESTSAWEIDVEEAVDETERAIAGDGTVYVQIGDTVSAYR